MSARSSLFPFRTVRCSLAVISLLILTATIAPGGSIYGDNAPEKLVKREHVQTFKEVTRRLNCFCGCHGLVSECLHVDEHCFAVQTRRFIENRVLEGMSSDQIVDGFVNGFGEVALRDPILQQWAQKGRQDLVQGTIEGFGPSVLHHEPPNWPVYLSLVGGLAVFGLLLWHLWNTRIQSDSPLDAGLEGNSSLSDVIVDPDAHRPIDSSIETRFRATEPSKALREASATGTAPTDPVWSIAVAKALDDLER